ncbi:MAG: tetratricopeptide repeat protein [bacterium]|nr:tetratricopeptide repeat protein [bacterium]
MKVYRTQKLSIRRQHKTRSLSHFGVVLIILLSLFLVANRILLHRDKGDRLLRKINRYERRLQKDPTNIKACIKLGKIYFEKAGYENEIELFNKVIEFYRKALALSGNRLNGEIHYHLGVAYFKKGIDFYSEAKKHLELAARRGFNSEKLHIYLGHIYYKEGNRDKARSEYKKALSLSPDDINAKFNLAWMDRDKGKYDDAEVSFREILNQKNLNHDIHIKTRLTLGRIYYTKNRLEEATKEYKEVLRLEPRSIEAHYWLGNVYKKEGKKDLARLEFKKVLEIDPNYIEAKQQLERLR